MCRSATCNTSSIHFTGLISRLSLMFCGMSARSLVLSSGISTMRMPPRCAASSFSLSPPIGSTCPRSVISPVIATSERTGTLVNAETGTRAVLRRRAFGHVNVHVGLLIEVRLQAEHRRAAAHDGHRSLNRLLHHFAELAGVRELAFAGHDCCFDRQQLAADFSPRKSGDLANVILLLRAAVTEPAHAEILAQ